MFTAGADALLGICGARVQAGDGVCPARDIGGFAAKEDGDKLIHPSVGEEQVRRIRQQARRRDEGVFFLAKEVEERLTDLGASHHGVCVKVGSVQRQGGVSQQRCGDS